MQVQLGVLPPGNETTSPIPSRRHSLRRADRDPVRHGATPAIRRRRRVRGLIGSRIGRRGRQVLQRQLRPGHAQLHRHPPPLRRLLGPPDGSPPRRPSRRLRIPQEPPAQPHPGAGAGAGAVAAGSRSSSGGRRKRGHRAAGVQSWFAACSSASGSQPGGFAGLQFN